ncbi:uncharacterized protein LOC126427113 isoform X4 [Schistocerca serialis cubense]|uniref:uncharacterized protein LOC126427113 isoform X4 n=1 Tax=Schistocerca serialis cubense TaxID=2023355 RepID=UPI00214EAACC|nr:uncharacterized protein LOC126427113 isoform X4 [Schistocerca serialis cubense]
MDQEPTMWIKKEGTDEVQTELCFMAQVSPISMNVKEELEEGAKEEFLEDPLKTDDATVLVKQDPKLKQNAVGSEHNSVRDPLGISWSTDFIKEDPELNLEMNVTENIVAALYGAVKIASVTDVRCKQQAAIEFLVAENQGISDIHRRLQNVYSDLAVDKSTVSRWAKHVSSSPQGQARLSDLPLAGRPCTTVTPAMTERANTLVRDDRRITIKQLSAQLDISVGSAVTIVHQLGYSKVCSRWVPPCLTEHHKDQRRTICAELLVRHVTGTLQPRSRTVGFPYVWPNEGAIHGRHYADDEVVIDAVRRWLRHRPVEWYRAGIQALISR